jgi:GT2 family glycosyltransferase
MVDLSIIIVNYNTKELTLECLRSILDKKWKVSFNVWLVDNGSTDNSFNEVKEKFPQVKLIKSRTNLGFAGGNNLGLKEVYKDCLYSLLLNSDTRVHEGSLDSLVSFAKEKDFSIASCKLLAEDGSLQPNTGSLPTPLPLLVWLTGIDDLLRGWLHIPSYQEMNKKNYTKPFTTGWVSGTAMLIKSSLIDKIGLLDDKLFMYAEDVDYCWRAGKAGEKVGWTDRAVITHLGGGSQKEVKYSQWLGEFKGLLYLYNKYYGKIASVFLKILFYIFILARILAFLIIGRPAYSKAYAKVFSQI